MPESGAALKDGQLIVGKAGTCQPLPSVGQTGAAKTVILQALSTNEGKIAVGGVTVAAKTGTHAKPEQSGVSLNAGDTISIDIVDTAGVYIDATVTGDAVGYAVLIA
jgi:hypothetical protein